MLGRKICALLKSLIFLYVDVFEDHCRICSCHSPRNLALLRRMALNALNQEKSLKRSLRQKMKRAARE